MDELFDNGKLICAVYEFDPDRGRKIPTKQSCDVCTFYTKQSLVHVQSSEDLEIRFNDSRDPAEILIDPARTIIKDGKTYVVAVLK
jgi:hypothetical protein